MENKKDNSLLVILLVIIIILLSVFGFLLYLQNKENTKVNNNDNNVQINNTQTQNDNPAVVTTDYQMKKIDELTSQIVYEYEEGEGKSVDLKINENVVTIKANANFTGGDDGIFVNGNRIGDSFWAPTIYTLDENLIFVTGWTDIRSTHVFIVDKNGKLVKDDIYKLDSGFGGDNSYEGMLIADYESAVATKDGINFKGTRITHGPRLDSRDGELLFDSAGKCISKYLNEPVYGTYEMKYLGNGSWGEITNTSYTLLKDSGLCN